METVYSYDATFEGFLTGIFEAFQYKRTQVRFYREHDIQHHLFAETDSIITDTEKADRVWKGLSKKLSYQGMRSIYFAFLSELPEIENLLFHYILATFKNEESIETNFADQTVLKLSQIVKKVGREKHRMEAFVRFKLTKDGWYFANVEPDFNVLPLIAKHFKKRYADQQWVIYDIKRHYGIVYNLKHVDYVTLDLAQNMNFTKTNPDVFAEEELEFQQLWQQYFKSSNIASRKNSKLHIRHVPKRYWKYLSEKQP